MATGIVSRIVRGEFGFIKQDDGGEDVAGKISSRGSTTRLHALNSYPLDALNRLQLTYRTYSRAGRVEFVWLIDLSEWTGEK